MRNVTVCTSREQLAALAPYWDVLDTFMHAPFGEHRWVLSCADTLTGDAQLFIPVVTEGRTPVAMAPLVLTRGCLCTMEQLGVELHGEPGDFNYRDEETLDGLVRELAEMRMPLVLVRTPAESPLVAALQRAYRGRGVVLLRPRPDCPFIDIEGTDDDVTERLPASLRRDLRRGARKAGKFGAISVETHAPSSEHELLPIYEEALKVEAAGWKGRSRSALQVNERVGRFYRAYASRACEQGILRILFLRLGPDTAATMIALETQQRLWILKIGYDERFAACSPGLLMMHEALRYAARHELRSFEFLGSDADWTRRWTSQGRQTCAVYVYPHSVHGGALLIRHTAGLLWRRARHRLKSTP